MPNIVVDDMELISIKKDHYIRLAKTDVLQDVNIEEIEASPETDLKLS